MPKSSVEFATERRVHIGIAVHDLDASIAFYRTLFDQAPTKVRPDYAKFEVAEPPINFTLNLTPERPDAPHPTQHFGIQLKDTDALQVMHERATGNGLGAAVEEARTCCYAVSDKVWLEDPDGHKWELFVTLQSDSAVHSIPARKIAAVDEASEDAPCCEPTCCT